MFDIIVYAVGRPVRSEVAFTAPSLDDAKTHVDAICTALGATTFSAWRELYGDWFRESPTYGYLIREAQ